MNDHNSTQHTLTVLIVTESLLGRTIIGELAKGIALAIVCRGQAEPAEACDVRQQDTTCC